MIDVMLLIFAYTYSTFSQESPCYSITGPTTLFITEGETVKLNLYDYVYGNSLNYSTNLPANRLQKKLHQEVYQLPIQTDWQNVIIAWDISRTSLTNSWTDQFVMLGYKVRNWRLEKVYYLYHSKINENGQMEDFDEKQLSHICEQVTASQNNITLLDCRQDDQQLILVYNNTNGDFTEVHPFYREPYTKGDVLNYFDEESNTYHLLKLVLSDTSDSVKLYTIDLVDRVFQSKVILNAEILQTHELLINDVQIYNNNLYYLIEYIGIVQSTLSGIIEYQWMLFQEFYRFNIYMNQAGTLTAMVAADSYLFLIELQLSEQVTILQKYGIKNSTNILQVAHSQQYSIIQAKLTDKKSEQYIIWIFDQDDRISSNAFYQLDYKEQWQLQYQFDPLTNQLIYFTNKLIKQITIRDPILTVHPIDISSMSIQQIEITGIPKNMLYTCHYEINVFLLDNNDLNIYPGGSLQQQLVVLSKSRNTLNIGHSAIGADMKYIIQPTQYQLDSFVHFINSTQVNQVELLNINVLFMDTIIIQDIPIIFLLITQLNDSHRTLITRICSGTETQQTLNCRIITQSTQIPMELIQYFGTIEYGNPIRYIYYLQSTNEIVLNDYDIKSSKLSSIKYTLTYEKYTIKYIGIYKDYYYIMITNSIDFYMINDKSISLQLSIKLTDLCETATDQDSILTATTQITDYLLIVWTTVGLYIVDPGLYSFQLVQIVSQLNYEVDQTSSIIQIDEYILICQSANSLMVINMEYQDSPYLEKTLPSYDYTIVWPLQYEIGLNSTSIYILAERDKQSYILCYQLSNPQVSLLYTAIQIGSTQPIPFTLVSIFGLDYLIQILHNQFTAIRIYDEATLIFSNPDQTQEVSIIYHGMGESKQELMIDIQVRDSQQDLVIQLDTDEINRHEIVYDNTNVNYINLNYFQSIVMGSVNRWQVKCRECPESLNLINYVDEYDEVAKIPDIKYIRHSVDYVFMQQEYNLIIINNVGQLFAIVALPISDPNMKCRSLGIESGDTITKKVISVCNSQQHTEFYVTSFYSSIPFAMGPFKTNVQIHSVTHMRVLNNLLFVLDDQLQTVSIFSIDLSDDDSDEFILVEILSARDYIKGKQSITYFDVALVNTNQNSFLIYLMTNHQDLIIIYSERGIALSYIKIQIPDLVDGYPSNVIPVSLIVVNPKDSNHDSNIHINRLIIINRNYHSLEFQLKFNKVEIEIDFIRQYTQYGYYQATGKARISEEEDGYFALICSDPLKENSAVLVVYDRRDQVSEQSDEPQQRKILGGYTIENPVIKEDILIDFVHKQNSNQIFHKMILVNGAEITSLILSRSLNIYVYSKQFKDQLLHFTASNDFGYSVEFQKDIYNETGKVSAQTMMIILVSIVCFVFVISLLFIKKSVRKSRSQNNSAVHIETDENMNLYTEF